VLAVLALQAAVEVGVAGAERRFGMAVIAARAADRRQVLAERMIHVDATCDQGIGVLILDRIVDQLKGHITENGNGDAAFVRA
jgi:hypothetical protein